MLYSNSYIYFGSEEPIDNNVPEVLSTKQDEIQRKRLEPEPEPYRTFENGAAQIRASMNSEEGFDAYRQTPLS